MFCSHCGTAADEGAHFCHACGAALPVQPALPAAQPSAGRKPRGSGSKAPPDPRKQQIKMLKLELKRLRIEMQQVNAQLSQIRAKYGQGRPFVPWGVGNRIYREVENLELRNSQQRKQALQQQIIQVEQQILALESQMTM